jgi:hypothetical protein
VTLILPILVKPVEHPLGADLITEERYAIPFRSPPSFPRPDRPHPSCLALHRNADYQWQTSGGIIRASRDFRFYETRLDASKYNPVGMKPFSEALDKLLPMAACGGRVRLNSYQLSACMIARQA